MSANKAGIDAAIKAFAERGIEFSAPWHGDLDDLERERFEALCSAIEAYISAKAEPTDDWDAICAHARSEP